MNILILFLFIHSASAAILARFQSTPEGTSEQRFEMTKSNTTYVKRSNFFDKKRDFSLGKFKPAAKFNNSQELAKLDEISRKIKIVDEFLRKKDSSFNDFSYKNPHQSFIQLDNYRIAQESDLYPELKAVFDKLQGLRWKQQSGLKLTDNFKTVIFVNDGRETKKEPFDRAFYCKKDTVPTVCSYQDYGMIYLQ